MTQQQQFESPGWEDALDPAEDDFSFNGGDFSHGDVESAQVDTAGHYHFEVVKVDRNTGRTRERNGKQEPQTPHIAFHCIVLASDGSPVGSRLTHTIWLENKSGEKPGEFPMKLAFAWGYGLGVLKEAEQTLGSGAKRKVTVDAATGSTRITPDTWANAKGKQFLCRVQAKEREGKDPVFEIPFSRIYHPYAPAVKSWPKNEAALAAAGYLPPSATPPAPPSSPPPAAQGPAKTQAPAPAASPLDNLPDDI